MRAAKLLLTVVLLLPSVTSAGPPPAPSTDAPPLAVDRSALPATTLRLLTVASTYGRERLVVQGGGNALLELPVFAYVIEHPTAGVLVIDAGFPRRTGVDVASYPGRRQANLLKLEMAPGGSLVERLPEAGLSSEAVQHLFVTHLHPDHAGGVEDFPGAALWVQPDAWAERARGGALGKPDLSVYAGRAEPTPISMTNQPVGPFARSVDVFGDGSLIAIDSPGHTAGHTSFLVQLPSVSVLITGDAAWTDPHWQKPALKGSLVRTLLERDWRANWASQWRVHALAEQNPGLIVLSGHDAANAARLPAWPEPLR